MRAAGPLIGCTPTRLSAMSFGKLFRMRGSANRVKSAMSPVVVLVSRMVRLFFGFIALCWFSNNAAMSPSLFFLISRHLPRTGAHFLTISLRLDSAKTALW